MRTKLTVAIATTLACTVLATASWSASGPAAVDRSFGVRGKVVTSFDRLSGAQVSVAVGSRGGIVAVGRVESESARVAVVRYLPSGRLDRSFSGDGKVALGFGSANVSVADVAIDRKGRFVIGGVAREVIDSTALPPKETYWFAVARLNRDGSPDRTFSGDGLQVTKIGVAAEIRAIAIDGRDRIVAAGMSASQTGNYEVGYALARYLPGGRLDRSFSGDGVFTGQFGRLPDGWAVAVDFDRRGRVVTGGCATDGAPTKWIRRTRFGVVRLTESGRLDPTFSADGTARTSIGNDAACPTDLVVDRAGRIVVVGNSPYGAVVRYLPSGRLDPTFSGDGRARPDPQLGIGTVALDRSGRIILGGSVVENDSEYARSARAVTRLRPDGAIDPAFGGGQPVETRGWDSVTDLAVDPFGRVVAGGLLFERRGSLSRFALQRYLSR